MQNESSSGSGNTSNTNGATRFLVTEVRVKLTDDPRNRLKAYCSVTIDDAFVVRDLKIIEGNKGPFVAMPSRKLADHCQRCHHRPPARMLLQPVWQQARPGPGPARQSRGRARLHADLAHPINSQTRIELHKAVVRAYAEEEIEAARAAGEAYRPKTFDDLDVLSDSIDDEYLEELERRQERRERRRQLDREAAVGRDGMAAGGAG